MIKQKRLLLSSLIASVTVISMLLSSIVPVSADPTTLSDEEIAGILFMREEEKLARDVYLTFADFHPTESIFSNIAASEQRHMDSMKRIIDAYDIVDPVQDNAIGVFADESLQDLYTALVEQGSQSVIDALQVGAAIEEIDILDIKEYLDITDNWMILRIYNNLLDGSENHLRGFVSELSVLGVEYQPQYLDSTTYESIIDADSDSGHNGPIWSEFVDWMKGRIRSRHR